MAIMARLGTECTRLTMGGMVPEDMGPLERRLVLLEFERL